MVDTMALTKRTRMRMRVMNILDSDWRNAFEHIDEAWEFWLRHAPDEIDAMLAEENIPVEDTQ